MTAKKDTEMKKTKIEIKIPRSVVFYGDYCSDECNFLSFNELECYLFKEYLKQEKIGKPVRCKKCRNKYKTCEE